MNLEGKESVSVSDFLKWEQLYWGLLLNQIRRLEHYLEYCYILEKDTKKTITKNSFASVSAFTCSLKDDRIK